LAGLRGFMIAAMMSAIMSSLTSIFNSASTVFTMDIWRRIRTKSSQKELLIVGRQDIIFTIILSIASISSLTCFMRYIFIWNLQFSNHVIINKTKVYVTKNGFWLPCLGALVCLLPKGFKISLLSNVLIMSVPHEGCSRGTSKLDVCVFISS
jgi:uncharacterized sodium:solute symporter family permease YidK